MCSCRTYVPMIACLAIPGFPLRAALRSRPSLAAAPAALAPPAGEEPLIGPVTALVEEDPSAAEQAWEGILRRLEDAGFSVESAEPGCAYFETRGVERLYGGLEEALKRALASAGTGWDARALERLLEAPVEPLDPTHLLGWHKWQLRWIDAPQI